MFESDLLTIPIQGPYAARESGPRRPGGQDQEAGIGGGDDHPGHGRMGTPRRPEGGARGPRHAIARDAPPLYGAFRGTRSRNAFQRHRGHAVAWPAAEST
mgnify:CR=1 FL=1